MTSTKITKAQLKAHEQAEELLWGSDKKLNREEVLFCLQNWDPRALAGKHITHNQAYFTPFEMALSATLGVGGRRPSRGRYCRRYWHVVLLRPRPQLVEHP